MQNTKGKTENVVSLWVVTLTSNIVEAAVVEAQAGETTESLRIKLQTQFSVSK